MRILDEALDCLLIAMGVGQHYPHSIPSQGLLFQFLHMHRVPNGLLSRETQFYGKKERKIKIFAKEKVM